MRLTEVYGCVVASGKQRFTDLIEEHPAEGYDFLGYLCSCAEYCPNREPVSATSLAGDTGCWNSSTHP